jgi:hypothetical protein
MDHALLERVDAVLRDAEGLLEVAHLDHDRRAGEARAARVRREADAVVVEERGTGHVREVFTASAPGVRRPL